MLNVFIIQELLMKNPCGKTNWNNKCRIPNIVYEQRERLCRTTEYVSWNWENQKCRNEDEETRWLEVNKPVFDPIMKSLPVNP